MSSLLQSKKVKYGVEVPWDLEGAAEKRCSLVSFPAASSGCVQDLMGLGLKELMGAKPGQRRTGQPGPKPPKGRTAGAVGWLWVCWFLVSCVWCKLIFSSSGFFTEQAPTRATDRGHSSSHSFRLYQFLDSLRFPGDFALGMMQTCGQGPVLPFAVLMCEQKTTLSWCSLCPRGPGLLLFSLMLVLSVSFNSKFRVFSYCTTFCPSYCVLTSLFQGKQSRSSSCLVQSVNCSLPCTTAKRPYS